MFSGREVLAKVLELSTDGVVVLGPDHVVEDANSAFAALFGYDEVDNGVVGRSLASLFDSAQPELGALLRRLDEGGEARGLVTATRRDGTAFQAQIDATAFQNAGDGRTGHVLRVRDLSAVRSAAESLRSTNAFLDSIVENIPDMVFVKAASDLRFVRLNRAGEELLGYARADIIGKTDHDLFPREQADFFTEKDRLVLDGNAPVEIAEEPIHTRSKGTLWLHTKKIPLFDRHGLPRYLLGISEDITLQKSAREALRVSEERFRLVVESVTDLAIFVVDEHAVVRMWNPCATRLFGLAEGDAPGRPAAMVEDGRRLPALLSHAAAEGHCDYEGPCRRVDGSHFWGSVNIAPLHDGDRRQFAVITRDLTDQRRASERQRVLAEASITMAAPLEFTATLESVTRAVVPALADGCFVRLDPRIEEEAVISFSHASPERRDAYERIRRSPPPEIGALLNQLREASHPTLIGSDGCSGAAGAAMRSHGIRSVIAVPLRARGRRLGVLVLWYDVSDHRYDLSDLDFADRLARRAACDLDNARIHADLQRSERGQRLLCEASREAADWLDVPKMLRSLASLALRELADGCVIDVVGDDGQVARAAAEFSDPALLAELPPFRGTMLSPTRQALEDRKLTTVPDIRALADEELGLDPDLAGFTRRHFRSMLAVPLIARDRTHGVLILLSASEHAFGPIDTSLTAVLAARIAVGLDNAILLRQAQQALAARDEFLSIAAHELRTPLTTLQLQLQSLARLTARNGIDERVGGKLAAANRQATRLGRLVDGLLDVSRIAGGQLTLQREEVDLADIVLDVVERFRDDAHAHGCELRTRITARPRGLWDPVRLEQVVTNLLANATKYAARRPIDVTVEVDGADRARLVVRDYGIGIPAESIDRVFGRFERAVSSRSYGGLGLGLYITKQIIDAHGGTVRVTSTNDGSTFVVELPMLVARDSVVAQRAEAHG